MDKKRALELCDSILPIYNEIIDNQEPYGTLGTMQIRNRKMNEITKRLSMCATLLREEIEEL